ncbi:zinc ribbon domain-containing protein [candidate division KSB1 bacterium]|nr:zinc ribbon domain-containing protein [candidate division KSB1 bacterium]
MPIYEYICLDCRRRSSIFVRNPNAQNEIRCQHCSGTRLQRILSRFAAFKSEESRLESLADPGRWGGIDENDPASVAKFVRKMGSEMGEDISKDEIEQMADEAAHESENGGFSENGLDAAGPINDSEI